MNTNFKVIGLTRLGIKLESVAPEADALTTRPSELLSFGSVFKTRFVIENCSVSAVVKDTADGEESLWFHSLPG